MKETFDNTLLSIIPWWVTPNQITWSRIVIGIFAVYAYYQEGYWVATATFALASVTDYLDGLVAKARDMATAAGKLLDERMDKLLAILTLGVIVLTLWADGLFLEGIYLVSLLILTTVRDLYMVNARKTNQLKFKGTLQLARWKTTIQLLAIGILLFAGPSLELLWLGTALLTVATVLSLWTAYIYTRRRIVRR